MYLHVKYFSHFTRTKNISLHINYWHIFLYRIYNIGIVVIGSLFLKKSMFCVGSHLFVILSKLLSIKNSLIFAFN